MEQSFQREPEHWANKDGETSAQRIAREKKEKEDEALVGRESPEERQARLASRSYQKKAEESVANGNLDRARQLLETRRRIEKLRSDL